MKIKFNICIDVPDNIGDSEFFNTLKIYENETIDLTHKCIEIPILSYIFGYTNTVDESKILDYFLTCLYMSIRFDDIKKEINTLIEKVGDKSIDIFIQYIKIYEINNSIFNLDTLIINTNNFESILHDLSRDNRNLIEDNYDIFYNHLYDRTILYKDLLDDKIDIQNFTNTFNKLTDSIFDGIDIENNTIYGTFLFECLNFINYGSVDTSIPRIYIGNHSMVDLLFQHLRNKLQNKEYFIFKEKDNHTVTIYCNNPKLIVTVTTKYPSRNEIFEDIKEYKKVFFDFKVLKCSKKCHSIYSKKTIDIEEIDDTRDISSLQRIGFDIKNSQVSLHSKVSIVNKEFPYFNYDFLSVFYENEPIQSFESISIEPSSQLSERDSIKISKIQNSKNKITLQSLSFNNTLIDDVFLKFYVDEIDFTHEIEYDRKIIIRSKRYYNILYSIFHTIYKNIEQNFSKSISEDFKENTFEIFSGKDTIKLYNLNTLIFNDCITTFSVLDRTISLIEFLKSFQKKYRASFYIRLLLSYDKISVFVKELKVTSS